MAAKDHLNNYQYRLFMTGDEIKNLVSDSVDRKLAYQDVDPETGEEYTVPEESMDDMWKDKGNQYLKDEISKVGIKRHVTIQTKPDGTFTMGQGHHRVQASSDLAKEGKEVYVPVIYDDDWNHTGDELGDYHYDFPQAYPENKWPPMDRDGNRRRASEQGVSKKK